MRIEYEDGKDKEYHLKPYLRESIFESVRADPVMFSDLRIEGGTIAWANGADIDPMVWYYDLTLARMDEPESSYPE